MKRTIAPLAQWIPSITDRFTEPKHLAPLTSFFDDVSNGVPSLQVTCSVPPRFEKTETIKHGAARALTINPALRICYVSYSQKAAEKKSKEIRQIYERAGGTVDRDSHSKANWRTGQDDGGLWATSIDGPITGEGFDLIIIDDSVKDRATVESALERDHAYEWFTDTLYTRREPGCSILVNGTRWHVDDLVGRLAGDGWNNINLPAIDSDGKSLCAERFSVEELLKIKAQIGDYGWASLYMGNPFARGGQVFKNANYYDALPKERMKIRIGCDFAYSTKARADFSAAVVIGELHGVYFILEVLHKKVPAPVFLSQLTALQVKYGGAEVLCYTGGQEKAVLDVLKTFRPDGLKIRSIHAGPDKFTRAQPVSAAWNDGTVLLPRNAPWVDDFVSEVVGFTGNGDRHDDQVDALSAAFDAVAKLVKRGGDGGTPRLSSGLTFTGGAENGGVDSAYSEYTRIDGGDGVHVSDRQHRRAQNSAPSFRRSHPYLVPDSQAYIDAQKAWDRRNAPPPQEERAAAKTPTISIRERWASIAQNKRKP